MIKYISKYNKKAKPLLKSEFIYDEINSNTDPFNIIPLKYIRISRKRFIKLLMSKGVQKNMANEIANKSYHEHQYYSGLDLVFYIIFFKFVIGSKKKCKGIINDLK